MNPSRADGWLSRRLPRRFSLRARRLPLRVTLVLVMSGLVTIALAATGIAASTAMRHYLMNRVDGN